jgi:DNA polymerase
MGDANKTSLGKLPTILAQSTPWGNCREQLAYYAAHTGRWGGKGVQIQNFPRSHNSFIWPCLYDLETFTYDTFSLIHPDVSSALSKALRGLIIPRPGYRFLVADFSQMEARVLAWLAGQQDVLDLFAAGEDLYCYAASDIYGRQITKEDKDERQVGKVAVLALGYGGGINAFAEMAATYDVTLLPVFDSLWRTASIDEREKAEYAYLLYRKRKTESPVSKEVAFVSDVIKQRWRIGNDKIAAYWKQLEAAVVLAMKTGKPVDCGKVTWFTHQQFLYCKLPGGRFLAYPYPRLTENSRGNVTISYLSAKKGRIGTYGGKLAENLTQAVQRDLLAEALIRLEDHYPVAFHVHDEMISEVADGYGSLDEFMEIVRQVPGWAAGIPIDVSGWEGYRYGKE